MSFYCHSYMHALILAARSYALLHIPIAGGGGAPPAKATACFMNSLITPLRGVVRAEEDGPFFSPCEEGDGFGGRPRRARA